MRPVFFFQIHEHSFLRSIDLCATIKPKLGNHSMRLNHMHAVMALKKAKPINEGCMLETPCFLLSDRCTGTLCSEEIEIGLYGKQSYWGFTNHPAMLGPIRKVPALRIHVLPEETPARMLPRRKRRQWIAERICTALGFGLMFLNKQRDASSLAAFRKNVGTCFFPFKQPSTVPRHGFTFYMAILHINT